jgi:hypothetical protein
MTLKEQYQLRQHQTSSIGGRASSHRSNATPRTPTSEPFCAGCQLTYAFEIQIRKRSGFDHKHLEPRLHDLAEGLARPAILSIYRQEMRAS